MGTFRPKHRCPYPSLATTIGNPMAGQKNLGPSNPHWQRPQESTSADVTSFLHFSDFEKS